ncbi:hypothetical protein F7725_012157 [Dissostichus mawsoni]|uniref:Uncharacterized protein n=1 Tax=Dissostichus mawsoni TaxID=36200 RepID=A0A7J5YLW5_DISMA|nr:hypothetical protein F7725_012157 [Dissostichus mawsoni]
MRDALRDAQQRLSSLKDERRAERRSAARLSSLKDERRAERRSAARLSACLSSLKDERHAERRSAARLSACLSSLKDERHAERRSAARLFPDAQQLAPPTDPGHLQAAEVTLQAVLHPNLPPSSSSSSSSSSLAPTPHCAAVMRAGLSSGSDRRVPLVFAGQRRYRSEVRGATGQRRYRSEVSRTQSRRLHSSEQIPPVGVHEQAAEPAVQRRQELSQRVGSWGGSETCPCQSEVLIRMMESGIRSSENRILLLLRPDLTPRARMRNPVKERPDVLSANLVGDLESPQQRHKPLFKDRLLKERKQKSVLSYLRGDCVVTSFLFGGEAVVIVLRVIVENEDVGTVHRRLVAQQGAVLVPLPPLQHHMQPVHIPLQKVRILKHKRHKHTHTVHQGRNKKRHQESQRSEPETSRVRDC